MLQFSISLQIVLPVDPAQASGPFESTQGANSIRLNFHTHVNGIYTSREIVTIEPLFLVLLRDVNGARVTYGERSEERKPLESAVLFRIGSEAKTTS
jgi:hypothetical protein